MTTAAANFHQKTSLRLRPNALLNPFPKLSTGAETLPCDLNRTLHLKARKGIRRTRNAVANVSAETADLLLGNLTV